MAGRVLVATSVHTPLDARVHARQLRSLVTAGWEVTFAAPFSATGTPTTAIHAGIRAVDVPRAVGRRRSAAVRAVRAVLAREGPAHDLVLLHDPELLLAVAGQRGVLPPVAWDVHEDNAAALVDRPWVPGPTRPAVAALVRRAESWADRELHLLLAEERYADRFRRAHPVVRNLPWRVDVQVRAPDPDAPRAVFLGRVARGRGGADALAAAALLAADGIVVELIGPVDADLRDAVAAAEARGHVRSTGFVPNDVALARLPGAVAGLSLHHDEPNHLASLPVKVLEYGMHGLPVVATPLPAVAQHLEATGGGVVVPFGDPAAIAAAVRLLHRDAAVRDRAARAGRAAAEASSWDREQAHFLAVLEGWRRRAPALAPLPERPRVAVVVPARDAAATLPAALASVQGQWPASRLEVAVAVGPSSDATTEVARVAGRPLGATVLDNPAGTTPAALNRAIAATTADVVVRLDAHSRLPAGYVERAVATLRDCGAANVGGRQVTVGEGPVGAAIAAAMSSRLATGGAAHRTGTTPGPADTVYLGVFRRTALAHVGGFDERLVRNQDYELNLRLRRAGLGVWFDPALAVEHEARRSWRALARQYLEYGRWRQQVARLHPGSLRARQLAAPALVAGYATTTAMLAWSRRPLGLLAAAHLGTVLGERVRAAGPRADAVRQAGVVALVHVAWGVGFWRSVARPPLGRDAAAIGPGQQTTTRDGRRGAARRR